MQYKNFEDYMQYQHAKQYVGLDDDMVDDYNDWLTDLSVDEWSEYGEKYLAEILGDMWMTSETRKANQELLNKFKLYYHWVGDEIGGVMTWGDWFVNVENMIDYAELEYTPDEFFEWYDQWMNDKADESKPSANMKNWKHYRNLN